MNAAAVDEERVAGIRGDADDGGRGAVRQVDGAAETGVGVPRARQARRGPTPMRLPRGAFGLIFRCSAPRGKGHFVFLLPNIGARHTVVGGALETNGANRTLA